MGYGYFDDQNDAILDIWILIEESILPKSYDDLIKNIKDYSKLNSFRRLYSKSNPDLLYKSIEKWMSTHNKNTPLDARDDYFYSEIVGVSLKAVKVIEETKGYDPTEEHPVTDKKYNKIIPNQLSRGFPETIRNEVVKAIKELVKNIKNNTQGYKKKILSDRLNALQNELYLFTRGREGIKGLSLEKEKPHGKSIKLKDLILLRKKNHSKQKTKYKTKQKIKYKTTQKTKHKTKQKTNSKYKSKQKPKQTSKQKTKHKSKQKTKHKSKRKSKQKSKHKSRQMSKHKMKINR